MKNFITQIEDMCA